MRKKAMNYVAQVTELSTEKVELSNIQFLNSIISDGKRIYNRGVKFAQNREAFTKEARVLNADADAMIKGGLKIINDFEKAAKELGVNPNSIKELKEAIDVLGVLDTVEKQTNPYIKIR